MIWSDEAAVLVLRHCAAALPRGRKVLVVAMVMPIGNDPSPAKNYDLLVLLANEGGRIRIEDEIGALCAAAGLRMTRVLPTTSPNSIIEAVLTWSRRAAGARCRRTRASVSSGRPHVPAATRRADITGRQTCRPDRTRLIDRADEVARIRRLLVTSRLVTITAVGGSGQTRLAVAIGEEELHHRPDGV